ncbi:MAG TPA: fumarylacetoacetate hydrolase family protein [Acidimicrobiia bacterium]|nr:fumarylacetoacetate hydrolase family protein [Acidimicrobiia bacterium]
MRFVTFEDGAGVRFGVLEDGAVRDVVAADPRLPTDLLDVIRGGQASIDGIGQTLESSALLPATGIRLLAPIPQPPGNVIAVGRNYRDHAQEFTKSGFDASEKDVVPPHPVIFTKAGSSVIGPGAPIMISNDPTNTTDYEGELGVVIGKPTRSVSPSQVLDHIFGYTIINDVTARALQSRHVQWFVGKSPDTFCPMGPCIVTKDEMPDLSQTQLRTNVNGETRQAFSLSDMIFDIPTLIATLSETMTLRPGDVIATGTGTGVGIGFDPPRFLESGDVVEISVDGIGTLSNPVE